MLTPRCWDSRVAALLWKASRIGRRLSAKHVAKLIQRQAVLEPGEQSAEERAQEYLRRRLEAYWGSFRALSQRGWEAHVDWEGEEHLVRALESGRGVVLWFFSFCQSLIMLQALREKGYRVAHLSRIAHGAPSNSFVGLAVLAEFARRAENRYLAERIVIDRKLTPRSMRRIERLLADNYCLTVRGDQEATPGLTETLFGKPVCLAPGAPSLAWKTGATLLTIGLYRKGFGRYGLRVDPPIAVDPTIDRKTAVRQAASVFTERLERRAESHPDDWDGWERSQGFWMQDSDRQTSLVTRE